MTVPRRWRRAALVAGVLAVCTGVVVVRAVWDGRAALAAADAAVERGDVRDAVAWYRRAARWYVPGAPHVDRAYERLEQIANDAEARGDAELALEAWRGIRGSILSTRSFYTPHADRLEPANRHIAALMAAVEGPQADPAASTEAREEWHYELLARDEAPSVPWSMVALLGFGLWIGGGVLFALRGITPDDALAPRPAAVAGALVAVGLVIWMLGLYKA
jgi:hypothetical protein